jgi:dCMP deaminase
MDKDDGPAIASLLGITAYTPIPPETPPEVQEVPLPRVRVSWDAYFMNIAIQVATRSTCDRKHVGAVIVRNKTILSTGYNGSPRGLPHCDDVGHELKEMGGKKSCVRTVHAEANAIAQAARTGTAIEGAEIYITVSPCYDCLKLLINSGIKKIICGEFYGSRYGMSGELQELARAAGVEIIILAKTERP